MKNREELEAERAELVSENEAATSWGAAVGARSERIRGIDRQLLRMARFSDPAPAGNTPARLSDGTIDNMLSKLDQGAAYQGYAEGFGFSWTQLAGDAATVIRRLRQQVASPVRSAASTVEPVAYLIAHPKHGRELSFMQITDGDRNAGFASQPLYAAPTTSPEPRALHELSDEEWAEFTERFKKPPTPALIKLMRDFRGNQKRAALPEPAPFLCPKCGSRGATDGVATTVREASPEPDNRVYVCYDGFGDHYVSRDPKQHTAICYDEDFAEEIVSMCERRASPEPDAVREIVDLYFAPWGAAKGARWEALTGDKPFNPEVALKLIADVLSRVLAEIGHSTFQIGPLWLPSRKGAEAAMTVLQDVETFVRSQSPRPVCDDCIADRLGLSVRQHANHKTREMAGLDGFRRSVAVCEICKNIKLTISYSAQAPLADPKQATDPSSSSALHNRNSK